MSKNDRRVDRAITRRVDRTTHTAPRGELRTMALRRTLGCLSEKKLGTAAAYYDRPGRFADLIRKVIPASTWEVWKGHHTALHAPRTQPYRTGTRHARGRGPRLLLCRPTSAASNPTSLRPPPPDPPSPPPPRIDADDEPPRKLDAGLLLLLAVAALRFGVNTTAAANEGCGALQAERHARPAPDVAGQHDDREGAAY